MWQAAFGIVAAEASWHYHLCSQSGRLHSTHPDVLQPLLDPPRSLARPGDASSLCSRLCCGCLCHPAVCCRDGYHLAVGQHAHGTCRSGCRQRHIRFCLPGCLSVSLSVRHERCAKGGRQAGEQAGEQAGGTNSPKVVASSEPQVTARCVAAASPPSSDSAGRQPIATVEHGAYIWIAAGWSAGCGQPATSTGENDSNEGQAAYLGPPAGWVQTPRSCSHPQTSPHPLHTAAAGR